MRRDGVNILITLDEWLAAGLTYALYESDRKRGYLRTLGRGGNGRCAEIVWQSITKDSRRAAIISKHGDPERKYVQSALERYIKDSPKAKEYFIGYALPDGLTLGERDLEKAMEYYANAIVLEAAGAMYKATRGERRAKGNAAGVVWPAVSAAVNNLDRLRYPHTLPANERRLRDKYAAFKSEGLASLVHKQYGNGHSRKVDDRLERLILSIYCMGNKPYAKWVHESYCAFIAGALDVVDMQTGELVNRGDFFDEKKREYITISESTCRNYVNNPKNRAVAEAIRSTRHQYSSEVRPHYHRRAPEYSLSKVTLDDRNLPRRMPGGKEVMAYYAYDVCSGAIIGAAYSREKNTELLIACVRDMFRFLDERGYGVPMEVEVENHLTAQFKDGLLKPGAIFPFVRFCAPENSQEKHAEHFNRQKKYGYEKREHAGVGRWYARDRSNRTGGVRVYDEERGEYVVRDKAYYSFEELVADDLHVNEEYNNGLHRNQALYKGKSRLDVLREHLNPELMPINRAALARCIGECVNTSIRRNMYVRVKYADYMLPSPDLLGRLAPNDYGVQAYWLPAREGEQRADSVFVYQRGVFLAECPRIKQFATAKSEWTEADTEAMTAQAKYISGFDKLVKDGKAGIASVKTVKGLGGYSAVEAEAVEAEAVKALAEEVANAEAAVFAAEEYDAVYQAEFAVESM